MSILMNILLKSNTTESNKVCMNYKTKFLRQLGALVPQCERKMENCRVKGRRGFSIMQNGVHSHHEIKERFSSFTFPFCDFISLAFGRGLYRQGR